MACPPGVPPTQAFYDAAWGRCRSKEKQWKENDARYWGTPQVNRDTEQLCPPCERKEKAAEKQGQSEDGRGEGGLTSSAAE
jgi:hypothetical protein